MIVKSGRLGLAWEATRLPIRAPAPNAPRTVPHAAAPPNSLSATTGPSTLHAPHIMLTNAKYATKVQSQRRDRNAAHPSRSSMTNGLRSAPR